MRALAFILIVLALVCCPGCKRPASRAERVYRQALEFKDADQTETALQYLRRAVELDPAFEDPYLDLASIYESAGDYNNAVEWYQKFLQVTKDARMKQLAQSWLADVRALAAEQPATPAAAPGAPAASPAATRQLVSEALAKEREQLQRDFAAREKTLAQQHERALDDLKDELRKLKSANTELQDKAENLTLERDAMAAKAQQAKNLNDIAALLANPNLAAADKVRDLTRELIDARSEADTLRARADSTERSSQQNAEQLVRLRQQLAEAQRGLAPAGTGDTAAAQLAALSQENLTLKRKLESLESSAGSAAAVQSAARAGFSDLSEEITKMQQTIEMQKTLLARRDTRIAQLEASGAAIGAAPTAARTSDANVKALVDELNRQLLAKDQQVTQLNAELQRAKTAGAPPDYAAEMQRKDQLIRDYTARLQQLERQQYAAATPPTPTPTATAPAPPATTPSGAPLYQPIGYNDSYRAPATPSAPATQPAPSAPPTSATAYRPPAPAPAAPATYTPPRTATRPARAYRVRRGDTLSGIAQTVYGDRNKWNIIFSANRDILRRADYLREGQVLYIPPQ